MTEKRRRPICQLKISLTDIEPEIWRRVQVSSDTTLDILHDLFQYVTGWEDCHLHEFIVSDDKRYGMPVTDMPAYGPPMKDERGARLRQIIRKVILFSMNMILAIAGGIWLS